MPGSVQKVVVAAGVNNVVDLTGNSGLTGVLGASGDTITAGVAPQHRAGLMASIFVVGYLAFSVPAVAAGLAAGAVGLRPTAAVYGAAVIALALVAVAGLMRRRRAAERRPEPVAA